MTYSISWVIHFALIRLSPGLLISSNDKPSSSPRRVPHVEGVEFAIVSSAKVLGVVISSDLRWSAHINSITTKAAKRLYPLRQLKRAGIAHSDLVRFYCSVIRSTLNMHARSSIVICRYISRKKLNTFSVVRYALFFLIVVTVKV